MSQTIFITGSSTGLGRATALLFASRGWTVIATLRHPNAANGLADVKNISVIELDVTRPEQVAVAAADAVQLPTLRASQQSCGPPNEKSRRGVTHDGFRVVHDGRERPSRT